ncbi:P-loop NTPase fold protein [Pedobacter sp. JY14-1]|uniref:YobI family P-loop NTPase n=1 Tax=Pedobacter sp. JY14-1 TaxID=3034151 RepID=UPI0023E0C1B0|nr:P-loop NTPase fold protein [Pedobacter sp. JY14-1]
MLRNIVSKIKVRLLYTISKAIAFIMRLLKLIDSKITGFVYNPNPHGLEGLTPSEDADPGNVYTDLLYWALKNPELKNVALTGPYGSGKSSIIRTFEKRHRDFRFLNISLASFDEAVKISDEERKRIELSILQQIFYKVKSGNVPYSRFRRIRNIPQWRILIFSASIVVFLLSLGIVVKPQWFLGIPFWAEFIQKNENATKVLYGALALIILGAMVFLIKIFRAYGHANLQKLNVTNVEVELAKEADSSILNKQLDEIIYFFQKSSFDVVVIEDLDRFKDPEIFTTLREINILINSSCDINRKITFVYALKDDIFKDSNRTKFFEFLIPVIPVLSPTNSGQLFIKKFEESNMKEGLSDIFLNDITLFINDMRTLKNIYNEYVLYKKKIGLNLNPEKLLAIIVYKNFYPSDFAELNESKGVISETFLFKKSAATQINKGKSEQLEQIDSEIRELQKQFIVNLTELRSVYVVELARKISNAYRYRIDGTFYHLHELTNEELFTQLQNESNIVYKQDQYSGTSNSGIGFRVIEQNVDPNKTFSQRAKAAKDLMEGRVNILNQQKKTLQEEMDQVSGWTLKTMVKKHPDSLYEKAATHKLLSYMIRKGFIDEMYPNYISHFHEGAITRADMDFVISIKNNVALAVDFEISKCDQIIKRLEIEEFRQPQALNMSLVNYLADHHQVYSQQYQAMIGQLTNQSTSSFDFLDKYLVHGKSKARIFRDTTDQLSSFWSVISTDQNRATGQKDQYLKAIIEYASDAGIRRLNQNDLLKNYIEEMPDFLALFTANTVVQAQKRILEQLQIKLKNLIYDKDKENLFSYIIDYNHYLISAANIRTVLPYEDPEADLSKLDAANYTTIRKSASEKLESYILSDIEEYLERVFFNDTNNQEAEEYLLELLNNEDIEDEVKAEILSTKKREFDLSDIPDQLWTEAICVYSVKPSWENLYSYWTYEHLDKDALTKYIDAKANDLAKQSLIKPEAISEEDDKGVRVFLALNANLSKESFRMMTRLNWIWSSLSFENLPQEYVQVMLSEGKLSMNISNYEKLKTNFNGLNISLIEREFSEFLKLEAEIVFDASDLLLLFKSTLISADQKIQILQNADPEKITGKDLSDAAINLVLDKRFSGLRQEMIIRLVKNSSSYALDVKLINLHLGALSHEELAGILNSMSGPFEQILARKGELAKLADDNENRALLNYLLDQKLISSIKKSKENLVVYRKKS